MRIGVVGARGFIGSNLSRVLGGEVVPFTSERRLTSADGRTAARGLDGLVWAATSSTPASVGTDPDSGRAELDEFRTSLEVMSSLDIARFVLISSGGTVYGAAPSPSSEDDELVPVSDYGRLKAAMEGTALEHDPGATILRLSNVYGPGQRAKGGQGVLGHWMQALIDGRRPVVYGSPSVARDYVYVDDCAHAVAAALRTERSIGTIINIGSGQPTTLEDLLGLVAEATGQDIDPVYEPGRPFDNASTWLRIDRARELLGWQPTTPLLDGIRRMWEWTVGR